MPTCHFKSQCTSWHTASNNLASTSSEPTIVLPGWYGWQIPLMVMTTSCFPAAPSDYHEAVWCNHQISLVCEVVFCWCQISFHCCLQNLGSCRCLSHLRRHAAQPACILETADMQLLAESAAFQCPAHWPMTLLSIRYVTLNMTGGGGGGGTSWASQLGHTTDVPGITLVTSIVLSACYVYTVWDKLVNIHVILWQKKDCMEMVWGGGKGMISMSEWLGTKTSKIHLQP